MLATFRPKVSHAVKHTLLHRLFYCKWDYNVQSDRHVVVMRLIQKLFTMVINQVRNMVIFS